VPKVPGEAAGIDANDGFSRFTLRAKNVVMSAQDEARAAGNDEIGPPHLILGLLSEPDGLAVKAIHAQGVVPDTIRRTVAATVPPAAGEVPSLIPPTGPADWSWLWPAGSAGPLSSASG
jgi:hypothetical protein